MCCNCPMKSIQDLLNLAKSCVLAGSRDFWRGRAARRGLARRPGRADWRVVRIGGVVSFVVPLSYEINSGFEYSRIF